MLRRCDVAMFLGLQLFLVMGCAQFSESMAIKSFHEGLEDKDIAVLKGLSTPQFSAQVLRHPEVKHDIELLKIPAGKTNITHVEEVSEHKKRVTVEIADDKKRTRTVLYELVKSTDGKKWMINDLYLKQSHEGVEVAKSITEQMDLLVTLREFLQVWGEADREKVINSVGPELSELFQNVPPAVLAQMTEDVSKAQKNTAVFRPYAEINGDNAIVTLKTRQSDIILTLDRTNHDDEKTRWIVQDVVLKDHEKDAKPRSFKKIARVMNTTNNFLVSYLKGDKKSLEKISTREFFQGSLAPADISIVTLPLPEESISPPDIKFSETSADFSLQTKDDILYVSLVKSKKHLDDENYEIDNVILYDNHTEQRKQLGALLTAKSIALLACNTLKAKDVRTLKNLSTPEFNANVWNRVQPETAILLPISKFVTQEETEVLTSNFKGTVTEITIRQGAKPVVYVLRRVGIDLLLDDVYIKNEKDEEQSLKQHLAALVPVYEFIAAIDAKNLKSIQEFSTADFNRRIWTQTKSMPDIGVDVVTHFLNPVTEMKTEGDEMLLTMGDKDHGAKIHLMKERGVYKIHDAMLVGPGIVNSMALKQQYRERITFLQKMPGIHKDSNIQTASYREENNPPANPFQKQHSSSQQIPVQNANYKLQQNKTPTHSLPGMNSDNSTKNNPEHEFEFLLNEPKTSNTPTPISGNLLLQPIPTD